MHRDQPVVGVACGEVAKGLASLFVAALQAPVGGQIDGHGLAFEIAFRERLVDGELLAAPLEHRLADDPEVDVLAALDGGAADADPGAEVLVGALEPGGGVHRVADGGVVEPPLAAEVADHARGRCGRRCG